MKTRIQKTIKAGNISLKLKKDPIKSTNPLKLITPDLSLIMLILSNILTISLAITQHWNLIIIMWIYWFQSIIIGIFNFIRILTLNNFSTENFKVNDNSVEATDSRKKGTAFFFLFHYGFFHFAYMIFMLVGTFSDTSIFTKQTIFLIFISIIIFLINHLFSFIKNYENDSQKKRNIGTVLFFPYARIVPMHLTIVFGLFLATNAIAILFFMILKTIADVIMHQIEHKL